MQEARAAAVPKAVEAPAAYRPAIPTVNKACCTHRAMTTLTLTVARLAMALPCKVISVRHVIAAMARSGERAPLVVMAAAATIDTSEVPYSTDGILSSEQYNQHTSDICGGT